MLRTAGDPSWLQIVQSCGAEEGFRHDHVVILETSYELPRSIFPGQSGSVSAKTENRSRQVSSRHGNALQY
jgi:hypothetical protein